jgi:hypothetical protein
MDGECCNMYPNSEGGFVRWKYDLRLDVVNHD